MNHTGFGLTDADFAELRTLVNKHTGIELSDAKRELVQGRLSKRLRALSIDSFDAYCELLDQPGVVGVGIGRAGSGSYRIVVYLESAAAQPTAPVSIEGVEVAFEVTGGFTALDA